MPSFEPFARSPAGGPRRAVLALIASALLFLGIAIAATIFVLTAGSADGGTPRVVLTIAQPPNAPPLSGSDTPRLGNEGTLEPSLDELEGEAERDSSQTLSPSPAEEAQENVRLSEGASKPLQGAAEPASGTESSSPSNGPIALLLPGAEALPEAAPEVDSLSPAPDPALVAYGRHGPLPVIAPDGRRPLDVYARPFDRRDKRPRIAIIVGGLGLSRATTEAAIAMLPPPVTLSFTPYAKDLQRYLNSARAAGHEVMLELPMEPFDYPHNDPGPFTLLTQTAFEENDDKLEWLMSRFTGYAGVINEQGDKLLGAAEDLRPILNAIGQRGLYFVDRGTAKGSVAAEIARAIGLAFAKGTGPIDARAAREEIDLRLQQLEALARQHGSAIGTGFNYPITIERVRDWSESLDEKGLVLAPVSALVSRPKASGAT